MAQEQEAVPAPAQVLEPRVTAVDPATAARAGTDQQAMPPNSIGEAPRSSRAKYLIAGITVVALAAIIFGVVHYADAIRDQRALSDAAKNLSSLNPEEIAKAVPALEESLAKASPAYEAKMKILLARTTFWSATPDPVKSVQLLIDVAKNESYPTFHRATAIEYLTEEVLLKGQAFSTANVMSEEPFQAWYRQHGYDVAVRMIDEMGASIFPLPVTNERIARWYANRLMADRLAPSLSSAERMNAPGALNMYASKAERLAVAIPHEYWSDDRVLRYNDLRAKALSKRYLLWGDDRDRKEALASFEKALTIAKAIFIPKGYTSDLPYQYAVFLAETGSDSSTIAPIAELAGITSLSTDTADPRERSLVNFFMAERQPGHADRYYHREILLLAHAVQPFHDFLEQIGWSAAVLDAPIARLPVKQ